MTQFAPRTEKKVRKTQHDGTRMEILLAYEGFRQKHPHNRTAKTLFVISLFVIQILKKTSRQPLLHQNNVVVWMKNKIIGNYWVFH